MWLTQENLRVTLGPGLGLPRSVWKSCRALSLPLAVEREACDMTIFLHVITL